jgi:hypothetical protein
MTNYEEREKIILEAWLPAAQKFATREPAPGNFLKIAEATLRGADEWQLGGTPGQRIFDSSDVYTLRMGLTMARAGASLIHFDTPKRDLRRMPGFIGGVELTLLSHRDGANSYRYVVSRVANGFLYQAKQRGFNVKGVSRTAIERNIRGVHKTYEPING